MCIQSRQLYLNREAGLLIETLFTEPLKMKSCGGKKVEIVEMEFNFVRVNGKLYRVVGILEDAGLEHLAEVTMFDRVEELIHTLYGNDKTAYDEEATCSGYLFERMRESYNPEHTIWNFYEDFCGHRHGDTECGCKALGTCEWLDAVVKEFEEVFKDVQR